MSLFKTISLAVSRVGLFWQEKANGQIFRWNLLLILFQCAVLLVKFNDLPPQIPLYYSEPWGKSQLSSVTSIFILPALSIAVLLVNNLLAVFFLKSTQLLSRLLVIVSLIFSLLSAFTLFQITILVS